MKCLFLLSVATGCGSSSSENCTYFEVTGAVAGACASQICVSDDVCQVSPYITYYADKIKLIWNYDTREAIVV